MKIEMKHLSMESFFKLGIDENCPQINWNIIDWSRQVGRLIVKKNVLSNLNFHRITMKIINEKPKFRIEIGSKMGLRGWNSIKNILKYGEFQFQVDFSAHKNFDRMRLSDDGIKEFMYGIDGSCTLRHLNINENNISHIGAEIIKNYLPKTKINELIISHNPLGNAGIQSISKLLWIQNFDLEYLDISSWKFNQIGALNLYTNINKNMTLTTLLMDDNSLRGPTIKYLTEALWQNKTLKRLSVAKWDLDYDSNVILFEGIEKNVWLHEVNLSENWINSLLWANIRELLSSNRSALRYLNLSDNFITNEAFENVTIHGNLKSLVLRNNSLNNIGARSILGILQENRILRRIDITKNRVGVKYMMEINKMIERNRDR